MRLTCLLFFLVLLFHATAQTHLGNLPPAAIPSVVLPDEHISAAQRQQIIRMLDSNMAILRRQGQLLKTTGTQKVFFSWPLRTTPGFTDPGYYAISNYVDHATTSAVVDYHCGNRSYNGHTGTDIIPWPFSWTKMDSNTVEVIAAAPGTIIGRTDGNFDRNCQLCTSCMWNAVYVLHLDGSVAWYGHLKTGTLLNKGVGETVEAGEYLGVVGSSGNSTIPHLHFEVRSTNTSSSIPIDPWAGNCNTTPGGTWWAAQEDYPLPRINAVVTHGAFPQNSGPCNSIEQLNRKRHFAPGETMIIGSYIRDVIAGTSITHRLFKPDQALSLSWNQVVNQTNLFGGGYYFNNLYDSMMRGTWRYEVSYMGQQVSANFTVHDSVPDLQVRSPVNIPSALFSGTNGGISFNIYNEGNGRAPAQQVYWYWSADATLTPGQNGDSLIRIYQHPSLAPLEQVPVSLSFPVPCVPAGTYYLFLVTDGPALIAESDESNNSYMLPVTVTTTPAVYITGGTCVSGTIQLAAMSLNGGASPQFSWYVNNVLSGTGPSFNLVNAGPNAAVFVRMTSALPCANPVMIQSATMQINCFSTAITEPPEMQSFLWGPNPVRNGIRVSLALSRPRLVQLVLIDREGRTVLTRTPQWLKGNVGVYWDLQSIPAGVYFLEMRLDGRKYRRMLVKI